MERIQLRPDQLPKYRRRGHTLCERQGLALNAAYDRFVHLVKLFADRDYDEVRIREDCPSWSRTCSSTRLCQADKDLSQIARVLGEDPSPLEERARKTAHAINEKPGTRSMVSTWISTSPRVGCCSLRRAELRAPVCGHPRRRAGAAHS